MRKELIKNAPCLQCGKLFYHQRDVIRHLGNKKPCKNEENIILENKKDMLENKKDTLDNEKICCKYCLHEFSSKQYKSIHENKCKQKDDPIRQLEIEQEITPVLSDSKTCCRYCDKELSRVSCLNKHILICNERKEYLKSLKLLEKEITPSSFTNTVSPINIVINGNVNVINYNNGEEDNTFITEDYLEELFEKLFEQLNKKSKNLIKDKNVNISKIALEAVSKYDKKLTEKPDNRAKN